MTDTATVSAFPAMWSTSNSGKEGYFYDTYGNLHNANLVQAIGANQCTQMAHADVLREGQINLREILESKFQTERSQREVEKFLSVNAKENENRFKELEKLIERESAKTQAMIKDLENAKKDQEIANLKLQIALAEKK